MNLRAWLALSLAAPLLFSCANCLRLFLIKKNPAVAYT